MVSGALKGPWEMNYFYKREYVIADLVFKTINLFYESVVETMCIEDLFCKPASSSSAEKCAI